MRILRNIWRFYYDGFRSMTVGKQLWLIIIIKLFVFFVILKIFFFKDFLSEKASTEKEKSNYVIDELVKRKK